MSNDTINTVTDVAMDIIRELEAENAKLKAELDVLQEWMESESREKEKFQAAIRELVK